MKLPKVSLWQGFLYTHALLGILFLSGAFRSIFDSGWGGDKHVKIANLGAGHAGVQATSLAIYGLAVLLVAFRYKRAVSLLRDNPLVILLLAATLFSATWSVLPGTSLRRAAALVLAFLFVLHLAVRFRPEELLRLIALAAFIALAVTWIGIFVMPDVTIYQSGSLQGAVKGFGGQKNNFGRFAALATLALFFVCWDSQRWRRLGQIGLVMALPLLVFSQSRSSWLGAMVGIAAGYYCYRFLQDGRLTRSMKLALGLIVGVFGSILIAIWAEQILGLLGRGLDFTNRTRIWEAAVEIGMKRPIVGAGYGAFWTEAGAGEIFNRFIRAGNGHNGYLDLWLELGIMGSVLLSICAVVTFARISRSLTKSGQSLPVSGFYVAAIVALLLFNVSEKVILVHREFAWALFLLVTLYLSPSIVERERPSPRRVPPHAYGIGDRASGRFGAPLNP